MTRPPLESMVQSMKPCFSIKALVLQEDKAQAPLPPMAKPHHPGPQPQWN